MFSFCLSFAVTGLNMNFAFCMLYKSCMCIHIFDKHGLKLKWTEKGIYFNEIDRAE